MIDDGGSYIKGGGESKVEMRAEKGRAARGFGDWLKPGSICFTGIEMH
jgi:hypothetical protein